MTKRITGARQEVKRKRGNVELVALDKREWTVSIAVRGEVQTLPICKIVNRDDLVTKMKPLDALQLGSWHGAYLRAKAAGTVQEAEPQPIRRDSDDVLKVVQSDGIRVFSGSAHHLLRAKLVKKDWLEHPGGLVKAGDLPVIIQPYTVGRQDGIYRVVVPLNDQWRQRFAGYDIWRATVAPRIVARLLATVTV